MFPTAGFPIPHEPKAPEAKIHNLSYLDLKSSRFSSFQERKYSSISLLEQAREKVLTSPILSLFLTFHPEKGNFQ